MSSVKPMTQASFINQIKQELARVDASGTAKRREKVIEKFTADSFPKAVIGGKAYTIFNSNDYLGLRFNRRVLTAEHRASQTYGAGPGAVRFISGTLKIYPRLEAAIAKFHNREAGIVFSSAFAANLAVISSLLRPQSRESLLSDSVVVISDELNHRSIIDGIRVASLRTADQKQIYRHLDYADLDRVLSSLHGKFARALVITDGVFSMLGELVDLKALRAVINNHRSAYPQGILLVVDDSHGIGACGSTGRGVEDISRTPADILVGTFGKGFGADGGYAVGPRPIIDYLREAGATYIYSNSIAPGTAGAALESVNLVAAAPGRKLLQKLQLNIALFKDLSQKSDFRFAADSTHPIQPLLIGDPHQTEILTTDLFRRGYLVTNISYPIVPQGRDEIRVQISAAHTPQDIRKFSAALKASMIFSRTPAKRPSRHG